MNRPYFRAWFNATGMHSQSGLTSVWGRLDSWCMASAAPSSVQLHRPSVSPHAAVAARASPSQCLLALAISARSEFVRLPSPRPGRSARCHRAVVDPPASPSKRATTTPVALRAYAHHCRLPPLAAPPSHTTQRILRVRRAARRHNGLPRHLPGHLRLRPPERQ
jgi:hypothetical protein